MEAVRAHLTEQGGWNQHYIVMDDIRDKFISKAMAERHLSREEAHQATSKDSSIAYQKQVHFTCQLCASQAQDDNNLIWIDKNFPQDSLLPTVTRLRKALDAKLQPVFLYLVPEPCENGKFGLPFDSSYLLSCFARGMQRDDYKSMPNDNPVKVFEIMLTFLQLNRGLKFDQGFLDKHGLDGYLELPLVEKS